MNQPTKEQADEYRRRLRLLVNFLLTDPRVEARFQYSRFVGLDWKGRKNMGCGTTACALGWGTQEPELAKLGLILIDYGKGNPWGQRGGVYLVGQPKKLTAWEGAVQTCRELFGLNQDETSYLFAPEEGGGQLVRVTCTDELDVMSPPADATASDVADHIERFLEYWEPENSKFYTEDMHGEG